MRNAMPKYANVKYKIHVSMHILAYLTVHNQAYIVHFHNMLIIL